MAKVCLAKFSFTSGEQDGVANLKTLVALGLGENQLDYLIAARRSNWKVIGVDKNANAVGAALCSKLITLPIASTIEILESLMAMGVVPNGCIAEQSDSGLMSQGTINSRFNLQGVSEDQANVIRLKDLQRLALIRTGLIQPQSYTCGSLDEVNAALGQIWKNSFNAVIKPQWGQGSQGVRLGLSATCDPRIIDQASYDAMKSTPNGIVLVEEEVLGTDISIEGVVSNGQCFVLAVSEKKKTVMNPALDDKLLFTSSSIENSQFFLSLSTRVIESVNLNNSLFHIEAKVNADCVTVIEWSARGCGSGVASRMLSAMLGVNTAHLRIQLLDESSIGSIIEKAENADLEGILSFDCKDVVTVQSSPEWRSLIYSEVMQTSHQIASSALNKLESAASRECALMLVGSRDNVRRIWKNISSE
jgi:hypothetical protein